MEINTIDDVKLVNKTVLLRVDINSPIEPFTGRILDDTRIKRHIQTIKDLRFSKVVILAHQSKAGKSDFTSLERHAVRLSYLLGKPVKFVDSLFGKEAINAIKNMKMGEVILLENTRFYAEEVMLKKKTPEELAECLMVKGLAAHADYFINDAFAAAHRSQPSLVGFAEVLPALAGRVMEREIKMLSKAMHTQGGTRLAILGGAKVDDSIEVTEHVLRDNLIDKVLTTGVVGTMFLLAKGVDIGKPSMAFIEKELDDHEALIADAKRLLDKFGDRIKIPSDVAINIDGSRRGMTIADLPRDYPIWDIGIDTVVDYIHEIKSAGTVILNGPSGVFENKEFAFGTYELFKAIGDTSAFTVIGGGHTAAVAEQLGLHDKVNHISTGGGALINYLSGKELPVVAALKKSKRNCDLI